MFGSRSGKFEWNIGQFEKLFVRRSMTIFQKIKQWTFLVSNQLIIIFSRVISEAEICSGPECLKSFLTEGAGLLSQLHSSITAPLAFPRRSEELHLLADVPSWNWDFSKIDILRQTQPQQYPYVQVQLGGLVRCKGVIRGGFFCAGGCFWYIQMFTDWFLACHPLCKGGPLLPIHNTHVLFYIV